MGQTDVHRFAIGLLLLQHLTSIAWAGFEYTGATTATVDASNDNACDVFLPLEATGSAGFIDITYHVSAYQPQDAGFTITSGLVDTFLSCDIQTIRDNGQPTYTVTIGYSTAKPESATQDITVTVTNLPVSAAVSFTSPTNGSTFTVSEDNSAQQVITSLAASKGATTTGFTFTIVTSTSLFVIDGDSLKTTAGGDFDIDNGQPTNHELTLRASLNDETDEITVSITIEDANDNSPVFTSPSSFTTLESSEEGHVIGTVEATDADVSTSNNAVTYSLTGTNVLTVNTNSGELSLVNGQELKYSVTPSLTFTVTATDGANSADQTITVHVKTAPTFNALAVDRTITVPENTAVGDSIYQITVSDEDATPNSDVSVEIIGGSAIFNIQGFDLHISTPLDADSGTTSYNLRFRATDADNNTADSAILTVQVEDVNDETPTLSPPFQIDIDENHTTGTSVTTVSAVDNDASEEFRSFRYSIVGGNDDGTFDIDQDSGDITLVSAPEKAEYILQITVVDSQSNPNSASGSYTISVDANTVDECNVNGDNPCGTNSVSCTPLLNDYECTCKNGWEGKNCTTNIDDCDPNPCANSGTCTDQVASFTCACMDGYTGDKCETDTNECQPNPCANSGTCTDQIAGFTCDCTAGWTGDTCQTVCTGHTYGPNCAMHCECNDSRVADGAGNQECDIITGVCICSSNWQGDRCLDDVNECLTDDICNATKNRVCENSYGDYECVCKQGYKSESNNNVDPCAKGAPIVPDIDGTERAVNVTIKIPRIRQFTLPNAKVINITTKNLEIPSYFAALEQLLIEMVRAALKTDKRIIITNIRAGSVEFDAYVVINNTDQDRVELSKELQDLRDGRQAMQFDGENVFLSNLTIESNPLEVGTGSGDVCEVYESLTKCAEGHVCRDESGVPYCRKLEDDNLGFILGVGLGVPLPILLALLVLICYYKRTRERWIHKKKLSSHSSSNNRVPEAFHPGYKHAKVNGFASHNQSGSFNFPFNGVSRSHR